MLSLIPSAHLVEAAGSSLNDIIWVHMPYLDMMNYMQVFTDGLVLQLNLTES